MENSAQWKKLLLPLVQAQASYFIFYGDMLWIIPWFWKYISLHPPGYMRRTWHWTEAGYNETNLLYHTTNCIFDTSKYIIWNHHIKDFLSIQKKSITSGTSCASCIIFLIHILLATLLHHKTFFEVTNWKALLHAALDYTLLLLLFKSASLFF